MENNAVVNEVLKIGVQWEQLKRDYPTTKLFCWQGNRLQMQYVDVFVQYQMSDASIGNDVFLIFDHAFEDVFTHGTNIIQEYEKGIQLWHDGLTDEQKLRKEKWMLEGNPQTEQAVNYFVKNLNSLPDYYEFKTDENLVILLSPTRIYNIEYYTKWLVELIGQKLDSRIKFMIHDQEQFPQLNHVTKDLDVILITPNVNAMASLQQAHKETSKDKQDPNTLFQKHLLNATTFLGKNKTEKALTESQMCLNIAKRYELSDSLASTHMFRSTIYAQTDDETGVFREITSAVKCSEHNKRLLLQNKMMKGSYALRYREKMLAFESFEHTPELAQELEDDLLVIEANRLFGVAAEGIDKKAEAWNAYQRAFETFKSMDEKAAKASTFMLVANQMLPLSEEFGYGLNQFMRDTEERLGKRWWEQLKRPKKSSKVALTLTNTEHNG